MSTEEYKKSHYDTVKIRFPKGTINRYKRLYQIPFSSFIKTFILIYLTEAEKREKI